MNENLDDLQHAHERLRQARASLRAVGVYLDDSAVMADVNEFCNNHLDIWMWRLEQRIVEAKRSGAGVAS